MPVRCMTVGIAALSAMALAAATPGTIPFARSESFASAPGFTLPDGEMVRRLSALYGTRRAGMFRRRWEELRSKGQDAVVEAEKERFCRRMYSLSPFVKSFKERIAFHVNKRLGRSGHVFEGRFFSGLVDKASTLRTVSLYIDYNPVRAGLAKDPSGYAWCSYAAAKGGAYGECCRRCYEATFGTDWADADRTMREAFSAKLPANARERLERGEIRLPPSQIIHLRIPEISFGAYVSRHADGMSGGTNQETIASL